MTTPATAPSVIRVNGEHRRVPAGTSATELLAVLGYPDRGIAIAVDGAVHPRSAWADPLPQECSVEILTAVQGG